MEGILLQARTLLAITPGRWERLVHAAALELLAREPAPGEWSALGCLRHLLDTETRVFPIRVGAILEGRDFPSFDQAAQGTPLGDQPDAAAMVERFATQRRENLALLEPLQAADLSRVGRHAALGPVTLGQLLHQWVGHDLQHTVQAERALMQPFIVGSGPWRGYFADHDVSPAV